MPAFRRVPRLAALLALTAAIAAPARAAAASTQSLSLRVTPNPVSPGRQQTITLNGARPGQLYVFTTWPLCIKGFGGGLMGRWRANSRGIVRFHYPAPTSPDTTCRWRLRAALASSGAAVSTTFTVRASGPAVNVAALRGQGGLAFTWDNYTYAATSTTSGAHLVAERSGAALLAGPRLFKLAGRRRHVPV